MGFLGHLYFLEGYCLFPRSQPVLFQMESVSSWNCQCPSSFPTFTWLSHRQAYLAFSLSLLLSSHACTSPIGPHLQDASSKITLLKISKWQQQSVKIGCAPTLRAGPVQRHSSPTRDTGPHHQAQREGNLASWTRWSGNHNSALQPCFTQWDDQGRALNNLVIRVLRQWLSCT